MSDTMLLLLCYCVYFSYKPTMFTSIKTNKNPRQYSEKCFYNELLT